MAQWSEEKMNEPITRVIVIGGGAFQGKSLTAMHISYKFKIPLVISSDTIRNILFIQKPGYKELFKPTFLLPDNELEKQRELISELLMDLICHYEVNGEDLIIEGSFLSQQFIRKISLKKNALLFCLNNGLPTIKRFQYKTLTRKKTKMINSRTGDIEYLVLRKNGISETLYIKYAKRIQDIHSKIMEYYSRNNLPVICFTKIGAAYKKACSLVKRST
jgi:2-phosphoglycerate kinase